jgi:hypothetical protein
MSAAAKSPQTLETWSWAEICARHPNQWVCLLGIECESDRSIRSARVVSHDPSIERALDQIDPPDPDTTVVHTAGRPMWTPRIEIVDESRDAVPSRR